MGIKKISQNDLDNLMGKIYDIKIMNSDMSDSTMGEFLNEEEGNLIEIEVEKWVNKILKNK